MSLGTSIGALLVASWFATGLTGALLLQTYIYFRYKPKDDNKIFVILVSCLPLFTVRPVLNSGFQRWLYSGTLRCVDHSWKSTKIQKLLAALMPHTSSALWIHYTHIW